jgi:hypothetical protein
MDRLSLDHVSYCPLGHFQFLGGFLGGECLFCHDRNYRQIGQFVKSGEGFGRGIGGFAVLGWEWFL